ncbi:MAG: phosphatidate cytidylyltransferase [Vicinamibacterales bacterium]
MTRVLSALVLIALVVVTLWVLPWWATVAVAALAAAFAGDEVGRLGAAVGASPPAFGFVGLAAAIACTAFVLDDARSPVFHQDLLAGSLLGIIVASGLVALASGPPVPGTITRAGAMALAPLYVGLPLGALAWARVAEGPEAITWLLVVISGSDSAQYYTGRAFGRRKLAPAVSPAKTVEGAMGGLVAAAVAGGALAGVWLPGVAPGVGAAAGLVLAGAGICGDLFESLLKRAAGVKDSSSLIPGHGGVLDRIDAYLFAAPLFYFFLRHVA